MNRESIVSPLASTLAAWRRAVAGLVCAALGLVTALSGCGGGVGVGGTGSFASGPIQGFGSVIVAGIRFDDANATLDSEDGDSVQRATLDFGMYAEVEGGAVGGTATEPTAVATRIRIATALVGPVESVDAAQLSLTVLDQTVKITSATVFGRLTLPQALANVAPGDILAVHGFPDAADGSFVATRIERRLSPLAYKLRGVVHDWNAAAQTFMVGGATLSYAGLTPPAAFDNGRYVLLGIDTQHTDGTPWTVRRIVDGRRTLTTDVERAEFSGTVTDFQSASHFSVNGQPVDATGASFPNGSGVALGSQVEVRGALVGGTLVASEVDVASGSSGGGDFRLIGAVGAVDTAAHTFTLQGPARTFAVDYGSASFDNGSAAGLVAGATVEVRGTPAGNTLVAQRIRFR